MGKLREAGRAISICGPRGFAVFVADKLRGQTLGFASEIADVVRGARVLEVGGPSGVFRPGGLAPIYDTAGRVDNVNYAGATLWESDLTDGGNFAPEGRRLGTQWLREATDLGLAGPYDVVVSSHTIEHTANPLRALQDWRSATRADGNLVLVLPHRDGTFDHRRPVTSLDHLREDERQETKEADDTHVAEILSLHDVDRDAGLPSMDVLRERVSNNVQTRAMHHHVFTTASALAMVAESGWVPVAAQATWPHDIVVLARNGGPRVPLGRLRSPFPSDRS